MTPLTANFAPDSCGCKTFQQPRSIVERVALAAIAALCLSASVTSLALTPIAPGMFFGALAFGACGVVAADAAFSDRTIDHYCSRHQPVVVVHRRPVVVSHRPWYNRPVVFSPARQPRPVVVGAHRPPVHAHKPATVPHRPPAHAPAADAAYVKPGVRS